MLCSLPYLQYTHRITHDTVVLSVETDPADDSMHLAAKIFCCFCNEHFSVRQYGCSKEDGSKGTERWVTFDFDTHMRAEHSHIANGLYENQSVSEPNILKLFERNDEEDALVESSEADFVFLNMENAATEEPME